VSTPPIAEIGTKSFNEEGPMQHYQMSQLVNDRHQELRQVATDVARARRAREEAQTVERRLRPLRLLRPVLGWH
jgi:hypothetical protein